MLGALVRYYDYPIDLRLGPAPSRDVEVDIVVNMDKSFRWEDQTVSGFTQGVFDTTPSSFEPIRRFGANMATAAVVSP